jgi:serine/threonine-protein kinase
VIKIGLKILGFGAGVLLIWALLFAAMDSLVMPAFTRQQREAEVPDLFEMRVPEAQLIAEQNGFQLSPLETRFDANYPPGLVIEQAPAPYTISKLGRKIKVIISGGTENVIVPEVVGVSEKEASFKLESAGLKYDENKNHRIFSDFYPEGVVISQNPPANNNLKRGSLVVLSISKGEIPSSVLMPDLVGTNFSYAQRILNDIGLQIGSVDTIHSVDTDTSIIIAQFPKQGVKLAYLSKVDLKISAKK